MVGLGSTLAFSAWPWVGNGGDTDSCCHRTSPGRSGQRLWSGFLGWLLPVMGQSPLVMRLALFMCVSSLFSPAGPPQGLEERPCRPASPCSWGASPSRDESGHHSNPPTQSLTDPRWLLQPALVGEPQLMLWNHLLASSPEALGHSIPTRGVIPLHFNTAFSLSHGLQTLGYAPPPPSTPLARGSPWTWALGKVGHHLCHLLPVPSGERTITPLLSVCPGGQRLQLSPKPQLWE